MPLRVSSQTILGIVDEKLTNNLDLRNDARTVAGFMHNVAHTQPLDCSSDVFKSHLQEQFVAAISAAGRLLEDTSVSALRVSHITALDRFAVLHFASTQRSLLRGLGNAIGKIDFEVSAAETPASAKPKTQRSIHEEIKRTAELSMGLDVPYMLATNPASQLGSYFEQQVRAFSNLLGLLRGEWRGAGELSKSIELAMHDYNAWGAEKTPASEAVRSYLNFEQQQALRNTVTDDVRGLTLALRDWLRTNINLTERRKEGWQSYRETLAKLPDDKITMFDESFGVRKVFVQPVATYKVAGVKPASEAAVTDVAGLVGTLISDRVEGDDLILLAGGPGSGKSTLCRFLAAELAANSDVHPVFLRLRRLQDSSDVRGFIETHLQSLGLIDRMADLAAVPNLVLILDGFDELVMASRTKLREFFNALKEDLSTGPLRKAKAIVSGRDTLFPGGQGLPTGAHVISLQPFDRSRVAAWGAKWREQHTRETAKSFYPENLISNDKSSSRKAPPLEHLVSWPLTLHLVARAHTSGSIDLKPTNAEQVEKAVLYRSIVADTALRQDDQAGGRGRLNPQQMRKFVQAIAWEMYSTGREALDVSEGLPILRSILPEATESDLAELADVTIVNQPELTRGDETGFEFVHKSFSEYFAAETIATKIEEACFRVTQWGSENETWRMSSKEAASALATLFGIRLLTVEVQEMLEPMLDDFLAFLRAPTVQQRAKPQALAKILEMKLLRFEELLSDFATGEQLRDIVQATQSIRISSSELERFGNYVSALLFIAVALARRRNSHAKDKPRRVSIRSGSLIRLLHIALAGDIQIDWSYAQRGLRLIDARRPDGTGTEINYLPLAPNLLEDVVGLESPLTEAITRIEDDAHILQLENMLLTLMLGRSVPHGEVDRFRLRPLDRWHHHSSRARDYLQMLMPSKRYSRTDERKFLERRLYDVLRDFRPGRGSLPPQIIEDLHMRLRELSEAERYRGTRDGEFFDRTMMLLQDIFEREMSSRKPKGNRL